MGHDVLITNLQKFTILNLSLSAAIEKTAAIEETAAIEKVLYCGDRNRRAAVEEQSCLLFSIAALLHAALEEIWNKFLVLRLFVLRLLLLRQSLTNLA